MYRGQWGFENTSSRALEGATQLDQWKIGIRKTISKQGTWEHNSHSNTSKSRPQQHVLYNVTLWVEWAGREPTPPSGVSLSSLQDNKEEIGFPGSNFSISRVVLHLHRGEVRLTVGRIPSATWSPNLESCSVERTLWNALFNMGKRADLAIGASRPKALAGKGLTRSPWANSFSLSSFLLLNIKWGQTFMKEGLRANWRFDDKYL